MATRNQGNQDQDKKGSQGGTSNRGFASMDPQRQREIAAEGGRAAHASGNAHEFTPAEAAEAGRKGGQASHGGRASASGGGKQANQANAGNQGSNPGGTQGGPSAGKSQRSGSSE